MELTRNMELNPKYVKISKHLTTPKILLRKIKDAFPRSESHYRKTTILPQNELQTTPPTVQKTEI